MPNEGRQWISFPQELRAYGVTQQIAFENFEIVISVAAVGHYLSTLCILKAPPTRGKPFVSDQGHGCETQKKPDGWRVANRAAEGGKVNSLF